MPPGLARLAAALVLRVDGTIVQAALEGVTHLLVTEWIASPAPPPV